MESEKERRFSPELCSTIMQTINDSCSLLVEDNIASTQNIDGNKSKSKSNSSNLQEIYSQLLRKIASRVWPMKHLHLESVLTPLKLKVILVQR